MHVLSTIGRPGVIAGFTGALALALGSFSQAFANNPGGWQFGPGDAIAVLLSDTTAGLLVFVGTLLVVSGWWMIRPRFGQISFRPEVVLVIWSLPLLVVPPVLTADAFAYADAGFAYTSGVNVYEVGLGGAGGPFALGVDPLWRGESVAWPPLSVALFSLVVRIFAFEPYWAVVGLRTLAVLGVGLIVYLLPRVGCAVGAVTGWMWWFGVLNPLIIIHFVGGAHIDALATGLVVVALWISVVRPGGKWPAIILAAFAVGLAMGLKQYAGLAVVAVAGLPIQPELRRAAPLTRIWMLGWRSALTATLTLAVFAGSSHATGLGTGWSGELGRWYDIWGTDYPLGRSLTLTPSAMVGDVLTWLASLAGWETLVFYQGVAVGSVFLGAAVVSALLIFRPHEPVEILAWGSLAVAASVQSLHPWYLGMSVVLLSLLRVSERTARWLAWSTSAFSVAYLWSALRWFALMLGALTAVCLRLVHENSRENYPLIKPVTDVPATNTVITEC